MSAAAPVPDLFAGARPFFQELLTMKASARLLDPQGLLSAADIAARVRAMQNSLLSLLRHEAGRGAAGEEVRHVLAAFADDAMLALEWSGREAWLREPLAALLPARIGPGVRERIDALLQRNEPTDVPLALVYLAALSLGFLGGASAAERAALRRRREELAVFVSRHAPVPAPYSRHVCPGAYERTIRPTADVPGGGMRLGHAVAAGLIGFLLVSHGLWLYLTGDLQVLTERIVAIAPR